MSLFLPGNRRSLRFTGEAKAIKVPPSAAGGVALGKPRVRRPARETNASAEKASPRVSPYLRRHARAEDPFEHIEEIEPELVPGEPDFDDQPTMTMDRDLDAETALVPTSLPLPKPVSHPRPAAGAPAPNFRPHQQADALPTVAFPRNRLAPMAAYAPYTRAAEPRMFSPAYLLWIAASLAVATASFFATPAIVARLETPRANHATK